MFVVMLESRKNRYEWEVIQWAFHKEHSDAMREVNRMVETWNSDIRRVWVADSEWEHRYTAIPTMARINIAHRKGINGHE